MKKRLDLADVVSDLLDKQRMLAIARQRIEADLEAVVQRVRPIYDDLGTCVYVEAYHLALDTLDEVGAGGNDLAVEVAVQVADEVYKQQKEKHR